MLTRITLGLAVAFSAALASAAEPKLEGVTCPVSGKPVVAEHSVDHNGGKVYFCCPNCPKAFAANPEKFAAKANHQLVATGQAEQKSCPLTGRPLNDAQKVTVGGVEVTFCCPNCKGKTASAPADKQIEMVFADAPFKKGFEVKKAQ